MLDLFLNKKESISSKDLPIRLILNILPHYEDGKVIAFIEEVAYLIYGRFLSKRTDRRLIDSVRKSLIALIENKNILCVDSYKDCFILDGSSCKSVTEKGYFTIIHLEELQKIMNADYANNYSLLTYFCNLISTVNNDSKSWHMSQKDMCECWDTHYSTIENYNKILEELKLIYIHRPNVRKKDGTFHKVNNSYGRYKDKDYIIADASSYLTSTDEEYYCTKSKMDGNARTSIKMRYNGFDGGAKKYDNNPKAIEELYEDCLEYNESIDKDNQYEPELLDLSIFDNCIDKGTKKYMVDGVSDDANKMIEDIKCLPVGIHTDISCNDELIDIESLFNNDDWED